MCWPVMITSANHTMAKSPTWKWQLMWIRHATEEDEAGRLGNMFK
jgi:hypothetical protein